MSLHEKTVIAGLCYEPTSDATWMSCTQSGITVEHFNDSSCRNVFECINGLRSSARHVHPASIVEYARARRLNVDWKDVQSYIDAALTIQSHIDGAVESIKLAWIKRSAISQMTVACDELGETDDPVSVIQRIQSELTMMQTASNRFCRINHVTAFRDAKVSAWRAAKGQGFIGIPSCFDEVNRYLGGYRRQVMTVIGGYRGEGKSTLARQEAHGIAKRGYKSLVVSLEDPEEIAQAGIAGNESSVSVFHLDTGLGYDGNIDVIDQAWAGMRDYPIWTSSAITMDEIASIATIQKAKHGLDFLVIDHLQYINPYTLPRMDRNGTIATYSQRICTLAKTLDVAVVVMSQFSRDSEKNGRKPKLSDLRDSGTIEQDARAVLLLYYDPDKQHHILEVAKNNNGVSRKDVWVRRMDGKQRFEEIRQMAEVS